MAEDKDQTDSSSRQLAIPGEQSIVALNREISPNGVDLQEINKLVFERGVLIPAGKDRQSLKVLPVPGFLKWEHNINFVDVDVASSRRSPPVFFAIFLFGIEEPSREIRAIKLPIQTGSVFSDTEDRLVRQMVRDGLDLNEIRRFTPESKSKMVVGRAGGTTLIQLLRALQYGHFETSAVHPELSNPRNPEIGRLESGWKEDDYWPLVIWSNWKARICVLLEQDAKLT